MVICQKCGHDAGGAKFCSNCGAKIVAAQKTAKKFCSNCGTKIDANAVNCYKCGARIERSKPNNIGQPFNSEMPQETKEDFQTFIPITLVTVIISIFTGTIGFFLIGEWSFAIIMVILVAIGAILLPSLKEAALYGGVVGLVIGALQNHIIAFITGYYVFVVDRILGNPLLIYIAIGIFAGVISNELLKNTGIGKQIQATFNIF